MPEDNPIRGALALMRESLQQSQFIGQAYGSAVTPLEGYVLIELDIDPAVTHRDLARLVNVDQSTVIRAIKRLCSEGFVRVKPHADDRRRRRYQITAKGEQFLELHDRRSTEFLAAHVPFLGLEECAEFERLRNVIATSAGFPMLRLRPNEHPLTMGGRRVTRALGFAGPSLFGTRYSTVEWNLLWGILEAGPAAQLTNLAPRFGLSVGTLSQILSRFERAGWIKRIRKENDARGKQLVLTAEGRKVLETMESAGERILRAAFADAPSDGPARFAELLRRWLGLGRARPHVGGVLRPAIAIRDVGSDDDRRLARGFLIFHLTRLGLYVDAPEVLVGASNLVYLLGDGERTVGLIEILSDGTVSNFVHDEAGDDPVLLADFLESAAERASEERGIEVLRIPERLMTGPLRSTAIALSERIRIVPAASG